MCFRLELESDTSRQESWAFLLDATLDSGLNITNREATTGKNRRYVGGFGYYTAIHCEVSTWHLSLFSVDLPVMNFGKPILQGRSSGKLVEEPIKSGIQFFRSFVTAISDLSTNFSNAINPDFPATSDG